MKNIEIAGREYRLKYTLRSLIVFEELTGASFTPGLLKDEITLYYSVLLANNPGINLTFNGFFDAMENENLLPVFREWLISEAGGPFSHNKSRAEDEGSSKKKE
ncbi:MAG: hypothetical protein LBS55_02215 [Prevotellaceae bacterium]|jgi:hypothetical protein|nr:hypothetical protein [Prevotellaceae bacterium]